MRHTTRRLGAVILTTWALAGRAQKPYAPELATPEAVRARMAGSGGSLRAGTDLPDLEG